MDAVKARAEEYFQGYRRDIFSRTDRLLAGLLAAQWILGILLAIFISPKTWAGSVSRTHIHVYAAVFLGGAIASFPVFLALTRPGWVVTRYAIAAGQMLASALLIHLTGGRIETHFHVFGSLAILAFYRDWRVLITATAVVVLDHAVRGIYWPMSVCGVVLTQPWRFFEHAAWVVFEDIFLLRSIFQSVGEMRDVASQRAQLEEVNRVIERKVLEKTLELEAAQLSLIQSEKLSAVGQLAAGVAHEINNPLGIILGFAQSASKKIQASDALSLPIRSIEREALRCRNLVQDLLTFSRQNKSKSEKLNFNEMVAGTLSIIEAQARVKSVEVVQELRSARPFWGDRNQLQQVVINLCSNAIDAMSGGGKITVRTRDALLDNRPCAVLEVQDTGLGIAREIQDKIFNPFFTTKEVGKGTGLGLSLVYEIVRNHGGEIKLESSPGQGALFTVTLPIQANPGEG